MKSSGAVPAIQWRDTPQRYGLVSRILHWSMALLILWQFLGMALRLLLGRTPVVSFFVGLHASVGLTLLSLIVLRICWTLLNRGVRPAHAAGMRGAASRAGHLVIYALMATIPTLGFLRGWGGARPVEFFGWRIFSGRPAGEEVAWAVGLADALHGELAWLLCLLVVGHVIMVVVHQRIWRDPTFSRMAGR